MAEPFKNLINAPLVREASTHLAKSWPEFDRTRFLHLATTGLDALEMKARAMQIASALEATLPATFSHAAAVIESSLAPPEAGDQMAGLGVQEDGLAGWILWPVGEFVARRGMVSPDRALQTLHAITQRFTAEFAIRPFLVEHQALTLQTLARWVHDDSAHVRRLVSEGSRPRLPWGIRLQPFCNDPSPTLPLLHALQDDASEYVRRSVANHLNDIAKDHPEVVADWLDAHLPSASCERRAMLRHASRTLIKQGHPRVLCAWGIGGRYKGTATLRVAPSAIAIGEHVTLTLALHSTARTAQQLAVDYAVHFVKADGSASPKVFKGWTLTLAGGESRTLTKRHSMKRITTRRYYPGRHVVAVQVNGVVVAEVAFTLRAE